MVSSAIEMKLDDLLKALKRMKRRYKDDPDYAKARAIFPKDWPM